MPISPNQGTTGGGTTVTITGTNLAGATAVKFGSKPAAITANTPTSVTVTSPSGSGTVPVTVTTAAGTSNPLDFYYIGAPFKASLSAASGPSAGGNTVTISGTGLATASSVAFGGNIATPTVTSDSLLSVTVPAGTSGSVGVSVTTAGGTEQRVLLHLRGCTRDHLADTDVRFDFRRHPGHDHRNRPVDHRVGHLRRRSRAVRGDQQHHGVSLHTAWQRGRGRRRRQHNRRKRHRSRRVHLRGESRYLIDALFPAHAGRAGGPGTPEGARAVTVPHSMAVSVHRCEEAP